MRTYIHASELYGRNGGWTPADAHPTNNVPCWPIRDAAQWPDTVIHRWGEMGFSAWWLLHCYDKLFFPALLLLFLSLHRRRSLLPSVILPAGRNSRTRGLEETEKKKMRRN